MYETLLDMPLKLQMQNIGAEVSRMVRFMQTKPERAFSRGQEAIKMLNVLANAPKANARKREFEQMAEEIDNYLKGGEKWDINVEQMLRQYEIFNE